MECSEHVEPVAEAPVADPDAKAVASPPNAPSRTSKLLCLVRHGQGEHNPRQNPLALAFLPALLRRDAPLTEKGKRQAQALEKPMRALPFELVVVSPLTRTIQTATEAFGRHPTPKQLCHLMCERTIFPSDLGTPKADLLTKHPHIAQWQGIDELPDEFWPPRSFKTAEQEVAERVLEFKEWLFARPETCFCLVGHSAFFSTMTGLPKLANCEAFWCELRSDGEIVPCMPLPPPPSADE